MGIINENIPIEHQRKNKIGHIPKVKKLERRTGIKTDHEKIKAIKKELRK